MLLTINLKISFLTILLKLALLTEYSESSSSSVIVPVPRPSATSLVRTSASTASPTIPQSICGGQLAGKAGQFLTPGFPRNYPRNITCTWTINLIKGSTLAIQFEQFSLESCCDSVIIRHGNSSERLSGDLGSFSATPVVALTNNTVVTVTFYSDSTIVRRGFRAQFTISSQTVSLSSAPSHRIHQTSPVPKHSLTPFSSRTTGSTTLASSNSVTKILSTSVKISLTNIDTHSFSRSRSLIPSTAQRITSSAASRNVDRTYSAMAFPSTSHTLLSSELMRTAADSITTLTSSRMLLSSSVRGTPLASSSSTSVTMETTTVTHATSEPPITKPPFLGCNGVLNGTEGSFGTPGFPGNYDNNLRCTWTLHLPVEGALLLTFSVLNTEPCCDYVELRDNQDRRIVLFSGNRPQSTVLVRGNRTSTVRVLFNSDGSVRRRGFLADYVITSPRQSTSHLVLQTETSVTETLLSSARPISVHMSSSVVPSATASVPVTSSAVRPPVVPPSDVQRLLRDILQALTEIIAKIQGLLGSNLSSAQIEKFKNETRIVLQQVERQLTSIPSPGGVNNGLVKRAIQHLPSLQELKDLIEGLERRLR